MALTPIQAELVGAFYEESFEGLDRAEALWLKAQERLETAGG